MAVAGFEGFEKRLELKFSGDHPAITGPGLRLIDFHSLEKILRVVQCTVVSATANRHFDAYVLSESSLFVYPTKIIIKTCGTTQILKSIRPLISQASYLGLTICACKYTRGTFIFPKSQPFPHTSFTDETNSLELSLPENLNRRKSSIMVSKHPSHSWHVFTASDDALILPISSNDIYTLEVCMTELDPILAGKFFLGEDNKSGKEMTEDAGINYINTRALICDIAFDPCGYSMNGVDENRYSTIHVTPEDGFSYASFECVGSVYEEDDDIGKVLKKVVKVFRPGTVTVATTSGGGNIRAESIAEAMETIGFASRSCTIDEFPDAGTIVFQMFSGNSN